jgi:hypothetical protein
VSEAQAIDIMRTVLPVVAVTRDAGDAGGELQLAQPNFFGTAFAVAEGVFVTADHVVASIEALEGAEPGLGGFGGSAKQLVGARVANVERFSELDVALLHCPVKGVTILNKWLRRRVQVLTDLSTFGYPHAIDRVNEFENFSCVFRAYRGPVVTVRGFDRLPPLLPACYEVMCRLPEGMSGAPAVVSAGGELAVAGVVIGEHPLELGGVENRVGIVIAADELVRVRSEVLGKRLFELLVPTEMKPSPHVGTSERGSSWP